MKFKLCQCCSIKMRQSFVFYLDYYELPKQVEGKYFSSPLF